MVRRMKPIMDKLRYFHYGVRAICSCLLLLVLLCLLSEELSHWLANTRFSELFVHSEMASTVILPLIIGVWAVRYFGEGTQSRAFAIDLIFSLLWFALFWFTVLYALTHYAFI